MQPRTLLMFGTTAATALLVACFPAGDGGGSDARAADAGSKPDAGNKPDAGTSDGGYIPDGGGCEGVAAPEKHRVGGLTCRRDRPTFPVDVQPNGPPASCTQHSDCTAGVNGRCVGNGHDGWRCSYDECFTDSECSGGAVCDCEGGWRTGANACKAGNCRKDADCGGCGFCSPSLGGCGEYGGVVGYFCHTTKDTCVNDKDCGEQNGQPGYCAFQPTVGAWQCAYQQCAG